MSMKNKLYFAIVVTLIIVGNIYSQCTISGSTNPTTWTCTAPGNPPTTPSPLLTNCNGIVYVGDGVSNTVISMTSEMDLRCLGVIQLIVRSGCGFDFSPGNNRLSLAAGSSIIFQSGAILVDSNPCSASERIYIGTDLVATCNGGAGADYTFSQLLSNGGYFIGGLTSRCGPGTVTLTGPLLSGSNVTYNWYSTLTGGTPIFTGNPYTPNVTTTTTYYCQATSGSITTPRVAKTITILPIPNTPTIGTLIQPDCLNSSSSVTINNLPSGTWTLIRTGTSSGTTSGSGTSTTITGLTAGTYNFSVSDGTCPSLNSSNVVINSTASTTWNGSSWSNGVPTLSNQAIINGNYNTGINGSFSACSLQINGSNVLTIAGNTYLEIQNSITSNGNIIVQNNGSLVQTNNAINTGNIVFYRDSSVKLLDYVLWSSPVNNFSVNNISPNSNLRYKWHPTISNPNGGEGNWLYASGIMNIGEGYAVRAPSIVPYNNVTANTLTGIFTGVPNNGTYNVMVQRGNDYTTPGLQGIPRSATDDNWNLIGNPYPSSLGVNEFLTANSSVIENFVEIWTHGNLPTSSTSPFFQYFANNYYSTDYLVINGTGNTSNSGDYKIGSGQGFFVLMKPGPAGSASVTFTNAMRSSGFANNLFLKTTNSESNKNRIWLSLASKSNINTTLIGYLDEATNDKDELFDAIANNNKPQNIYTILNNECYAIQGRNSNLDINESIPIGIKIPTDGEYKIGLSNFEGIFEKQTLYLIDKYENYIHDLKNSIYSFNSKSGIINDRFVLKYTNDNVQKLSSYNTENQIFVGILNNQLTLKSSQENIIKYEVTDLFGRVLVIKEKLNNKEILIESLVKNNQPLIIKIQLDNNTEVMKKFIF